MKRFSLQIARFATVFLLFNILVIWTKVYWLFVINLLIFDFFANFFVDWQKVKLSMIQKTKFFGYFIEVFVIALFLVLIVKWFLVKPFSINSESMDSTLKKDDIVFVNLLSFGPRLDIFNYQRLSGVGEIKNKDIIAFNNPVGDTVFVGYPKSNYYSWVRFKGIQYVKDNFKIKQRPLNKREIFIKRCIALPGDTLSIVESVVYVNHKIIPTTPLMKFKYDVFTSRDFNIDTASLILDLSQQEISDGYISKFQYVLPLNQLQYQKVKAMENIERVEPVLFLNNVKFNLEMFPNTPDNTWNINNIKEIMIPAKGETIQLNLSNLPVYWRLIETYENNQLAIKDGNIYINDKKTCSYTFKKDYFWVMGDNRHQSFDSRFWGFLPEDHIIGKVTNIAFRRNKGIIIVE